MSVTDTKEIYIESGRDDGVELQATISRRNEFTLYILDDCGHAMDGCLEDVDVDVACRLRDFLVYALQGREVVGLDKGLAP